MAKADYTIPVKFKIGEARYRYGWVRKFKPDKDGKIRILMPVSGYSTRDFDTVEQEPLGFNKRNEEIIN